MHNVPDLTDRTLEAVSLLSPGRGLRRAAAEDLARRPEGLGWKIAAKVTGIAADRVTMNAALGPLHDKATKAELTFGSEPENRGRLVTIDFVVEGAGLGLMADGVNMVMDQAFDRLVHQIEYGEPPQP